jgi:hypothetical protein
MARPLVEVAGAGAKFGSQMPLTHFSEAQSAGVMQLPPFGTRVLVGVIDGVSVGVLVAVLVAVLVVVAVAVLLAVLDAVAVGVTVGVFVWQVSLMQDESGLKTPPGMVAQVDSNVSEQPSC